MIYLAIIVIYFTIMIAIGISSRRSTGSTEGFFVAGRRGSTLFITGSLVATIIGGSAVIGMSGLGFSRGITGAWWMLAGSIGLLVLGLFFAEKVRAYALYTLPQLVEKQYGTSVSVVISVLIIIAWLGVIAGQIVAAGQVLSVTGIGDTTLWMIIFTLIFVTYTLIGGQQADIRTDILQAVVIFFGIFSCLVIVLAQIGGWGGLVSVLPADKLSFPVSSGFTMPDLVSYLFVIGLVYAAGPDIYSRLFCAKDVKAARNAALWSAFIIIPFALSITVIGMSASILVPDIRPDQVFPTLLREHLPAPIGGLILAALISATMSSADSCIMSAGTIFTVNIVKHISPKVSEKQMLVIAKSGIVVLGILSLLLALLLKGVISALLFAYTVYSGGVIIPVLFGFYKDRFKLTSAGALASIVGGGTTAMVSKLAGIKYMELGALFISVILLFAISSIHHKIGDAKNKNSGTNIY
ncbi:MAG: sodium:solute symporter [Spirochaetae bacterium HGW-Spirochaetae-1]|jgi:SSS family solute:Na+ symporter|nr:MAG: sodium:solute symporter [Spirochaetae bacterium HGW-Spirochaetae-1]